jgi:putative sterol carrier protein
MNPRCFSFSLLLAAIFAMSCSDASAASIEDESHTPQEVFDGMIQSFHGEKAKGLHVRYQFELSGPHGGEWWIEVNDGKCKLGKGKVAHPSVTYVATDNDWVALSNGKLGGFWAYLTGRLKILGDQNLARIMGEMFD